jgi:flagella basal body P-ring formation protein FlgA
MRAVWTCAALVVAVTGAAQADERAAAPVMFVEASDMQSLQHRLLDLAEQRLQSTGLFVDRQRAWMSLSSSLPAADTYIYEVLPGWRADGQAPMLPLTFELQPRLPAVPPGAAGDPPNAPTIRATLGVPLSREVWVAARRLRKGSAVTCADLSMQRRDVRELPRLSLALPCDIEPDSVALRDIAAGDVVRTVDVGEAPDVSAGARVRVNVTTGAVSVATTAIALADARVGDQIDVRLQRPARTLRTRVTAPGSVQLIDGSQ